MTDEALRLLHRIIGLSVMCSDQHRVGRVDDVLLNPRTSRAEWIAVRPSQLSRQVTPIPAEYTTIEGIDVHTPYTTLDVRNAPRYRAHASLTKLDQKRLQSYWRGRPLTDSSTQ